MVIADHIRNVDILLVHATHGDAGNDRGTSLVHPVNQIVQYTVILNQIRIFGAVHGNLIGQTPDTDGRMVIALSDQFLHLQMGILVGAGHMTGNIGNLRPDNHAPFITEIVEILVMLIVGKTDGIGTHFADQIHVFQMMLLQQCVANLPAVLMAADTPEGILFTVQDETLFRMDLKAAAAKTGRNLIQHFPTPSDFCFCGVEVRILDAVPQMGIFDHKGCLFSSAVLLGNQIAFCIQNPIGNHITLTKIHDIGLDLHIGVVAIHNRGYIYAGATQMFQFKMSFRNSHDVHAAVQTTVEGKVCSLGIHGFIGSIVHQNHQTVLITQCIGNFHTPGRVATVMVGKPLAVHIYIGRRIGTVNLQKIFLTFGQVTFGKILRITAGSAEVIITAILTILSIPGMGQIHHLTMIGNMCRCFGHSLYKGPTLVNIQYSSHLNLLYEKSARSGALSMADYSPLLAFRVAVLSLTFFLLRG